MSARPLFSSLLSTSHAPLRTKARFFSFSSHLRPSTVLSKSPLQSRSLLAGSFRSISTQPSPISTAQGISWARLGLTAAGVAGTVVIIEAFLNRETRDSLSTSEQSYLHEAFQYTGGGLAITALAARALFKNGIAYRVMSANPCTFLRPCSTLYVVLTVHLRACYGCQLGRIYWNHDGCYIYCSREHGAETSFLACECSYWHGHIKLTIRPTGLQCMSSNHPQPSLLFQSCYSFSCCPVHGWCSWFSVICWRHRQVRLHLLFLNVR